MYKKLLLIALLAMPLPLLVNCSPTHCERWQGSTQFRCAKDNYEADSIHIRNIAGKNVSIDKRMSKCGQRGVLYAYGERHLGPGASTDESFKEAGANSCNEMIIYDCKQDGQSSDCINVVIVTPSFQKKKTLCQMKQLGNKPVWETLFAEKAENPTRSFKKRLH